MLKQSWEMPWFGFSSSVHLVLFHGIFFCPDKVLKHKSGFWKFLAATDFTVITNLFYRVKVENPFE
jgi:hypothetical protein